MSAASSTVAKPAPKHPQLRGAIEAIIDSAGSTRSPKAFFRDFVRIVAQTLGARYGLLEVRLHGHVAHECFADPISQKAFWDKTAESALTDAMTNGGARARLYRARAKDGGVALLSAPLRTNGGACSGAVLVITPFGDGDSIHERLIALEAMASLAAQLSGSLCGAATSRAASGDDASLANLRRVADFTSTTELAFTLTNRLRMRDGCELVALARVTKQQVRLLSISGLSEFTTKSPAVRSMQAAMEECVDLRKAVVYQAQDKLPESVALTGRLHQAWSESCSNAAVASVPLRIGDDIVAILAIRRKGQAPFSADALDGFKKLVEPYASTLTMVERAGRSLFAHARQSTRTTFAELLVHEHYGKKLKVLVPLFVAAWLAFGTLSYELSVPCSISPLVARQVGAPQGGRLVALHAQPGDAVRAGDVLCEFDSSELVLDQRRLESEIAIQEIAESRALADSNPVEIQLARANIRQLSAALELTLLHVSASVVRAPVDGVVVEGDLRERIDDVFEKGDRLFEISASKGWKLELEVPEDGISDVTAGMPGRFANVARPEDTHPFRVRRLHPSAHADQGRNVILVEAEVDIDDEWVRYGMEGRAKIEVGRRNSWWVLFHRFDNWVRLNLWL